ncbi:MAG: hypothetical protein J5842_07140, partial [Lachnospiraceae bacterium]|nr:hypothetical protein [Lachnospiraceae bacterium]
MKKRNKEMSLVMIVFFLAIAAIIYAIIRYLKLWKCTGLSPVIYFAAEIVLTAIMVFSAFNLGKLNDSFIVPVFQFISAIQFIILIYSAIFFLLRDIIALVSLIFKNSKGFRDKLYSPTFMLVLLIALVILGIAGFINMGIIRQKTCEINIAKKAEVDSMNFAVVADLHIGTG